MLIGGLLECYTDENPEAEANEELPVLVPDAFRLLLEPSGDPGLLIKHPGNPVGRAYRKDHHGKKRREKLLKNKCIHSYMVLHLSTKVKYYDIYN